MDSSIIRDRDVLLTGALPCFSRENKAFPNQDVDTVWHESPEKLCEPDTLSRCGPETVRPWVLEAVSGAQGLKVSGSQGLRVSGSQTGRVPPSEVPFDFDFIIYFYRPPP